MLYPATEEVLALQLRFTLCCWLVVTAVPLPERVSESGEFEALLTNEAVAETAPLLCGSKVIVNEALFPAAIVTGSVGPLNLNSLLFVPAEEMVTLVPLAVTVLDTLLVAPTLTLPKLMDVGEAFREPLAVPVPERETVTWERL
jgi:hypothetical protein